MHWSKRPEIKTIREKFYNRQLDVGLKFKRGQTDALQAIKEAYEVYDDATEEVFAIASPKLLKAWRRSRSCRVKYFDTVENPDYDSATRELVSWDCFVRQTDNVINSLVTALKEMKREMPGM